MNFERESWLTDGDDSDAKGHVHRGAAFWTGSGKIH